MLTNLHKIKAANMDLRDYFASDAMKAMLKNNSTTCQTLNYEEDKEVGDLAAGCIAEGAYQMADAMMKAREQG